MIKKEQKEYTYDVFISHESESSLVFVEQLAKWFEHDNNISCWYAPRNLDNSGAGKDYDDEIVNAIRDSNCVVVVINDAALQSKWVKREVSQAEKQNKMIFPFAISELTINNGLLMRLEDRHIIAAYPDAERKFPLLLKNVKQLIGQDVSDITIDDNNTTSVIQRNIENEFDLDYDEGMAFLEVNQDRNAFLAFLRAAEKGNEGSYDLLIEIARRNSKNVQFLDDSIWERIEELSDQGKWFADLLMHFRYYAMGTQNEIAIKYLLRSMKTHVSPIAFLQLGICYGWGLGVKISDVLAMHYYTKALEGGCGIACRYIGQLYLYGGENIEKDLDSAEEYLKKGIEMKANMCYNQLFRLYANNDNLDKAKDLAQQMIDNKIRGGYKLMGDYYSIYIQDTDEAIKWYKKAVKHNENEAWGDLAFIYWDNNEREEAYRLANKGYMENNSSSFIALGWMYESDNDLKTAWYYYHQAFIRFGNNAYHLGRLYFDNNYLPDNYKVSDLKHDLELGARNQDLDSVKYLLKILLKENGKAFRSTDFSYDSLKDIPDSYEFIRLGAKEGDPDLLFTYGRLLMESEGKMHDPYTGIDFIETAAEKGNLSARKYELRYFDKNSDAAKLSEISKQVINNDLFVDELSGIVINNANAVEDLNIVKWLFDSMQKMSHNTMFKYKKTFKSLFMQVIEKRTDDIKEWLTGGIKRIVDGDISVPVDIEDCLFGAYLNIDEEKVDSNLLLYIRPQININNLQDLLRIRYYKKLIPRFWPNYSDVEILNGDFTNEKNLRIFYGANTDSDSYPTALQYEEQFLSYINESILSEYDYPIGLEATKTKELFRSYKELLDAYQLLIFNGTAIDLGVDMTSVIKSSKICCSVETILSCCLNSVRMLIASQKAFGNDWEEIVNNLNDLEHLLNIADKTTDADAQLLLIEFVEVEFEKNNALSFVFELRDAFVYDNHSFISNSINDIVEELNKSGVKHKLELTTEDGLPASIFPQKHSKSSTDIITK